jgi:hypothetical protein
VKIALVASYPRIEPLVLTQEEIGRPQSCTGHDGKENISVPWLRHYVTSQKVADSIPDEVIRFFSLPDFSSCTMALGLTQSVTEMSTRNLPGGKRQLVCKADNLTAIYEPIV